MAQACSSVLLLAAGDKMAQASAQLENQPRVFRLKSQT